MMTIKNSWFRGIIGVSQGRIQEWKADELNESNEMDS